MGKFIEQVTFQLDHVTHNWNPRWLLTVLQKPKLLTLMYQVSHSKAPAYFSILI